MLFLVYVAHALANVCDVCSLCTDCAAESSLEAADCVKRFGEEIASSSLASPLPYHFMKHEVCLLDLC